MEEMSKLSSSEAGVKKSKAARAADERLIYRYILQNQKEKLEEHLRKTELDIGAIFNMDGQTPLQYAANKDHFWAAQTLLNYYKLVQSSEMRPLKRTLKEWINMRARSDEGFSALHFAAFHGNMQFIRLLVANGANIGVENPLGMSALHLAAQGDQPTVLYYLTHECDMDINGIDSKGSSPLHWATFSSSDQAVGYLLAWKADIQQTEMRGLTPLHLAIRPSETTRSLKTLKTLLFRGADASARDNNGRTPVDWCSNIQDEEWRKVVVELLESTEQNKSCFGRCKETLMITMPLKPPKKSPGVMLFYIILMIVVTFLTHTLAFPFLDENYFWAKILQNITLMSTFLFGFLTWAIHPGVLRLQQARPGVPFMSLLEHNDPSKLCPECEVIRTPRSRHCLVCGVCMDRFDHHCPWLNTCVGRRNHGVFLVFVGSQAMYLLTSLLLCLLFFFEHNKGIELSCTRVDWCFLIHNWYTLRFSPILPYISFTFLMILALLFLLPVSSLLVIQSKNFCTGQTTGERYRKVKPQTTDRRGNEVVANRSILQNCGTMCCESQLQPQRPGSITSKESPQSDGYIQI